MKCGTAVYKAEKTTHALCRKMKTKVKAQVNAPKRGKQTGSAPVPVPGTQYPLQGQGRFSKLIELCVGGTHTHT